MQNISNQLHDWFTKLNTNCNSSLFISQSPGSGKTTIEQPIFNSLWIHN